MLADPFAPEMIAAVTPWMMPGVEIDPVLLGTARKVIPALANSATLEHKAALETSDVDPARHLEIDCWFHFLLLPSVLTSSQFEKSYTALIPFRRE